MFASAAFYPQQGGEVWVHGEQDVELRQRTNNGISKDVILLEWKPMSYTHNWNWGERKRGRIEFVDSK